MTCHIALKSSLAAALLCVLATYTVNNFALTVNVSDSLPKRFYLLKKASTFKRGDVVLFDTALGDEPFLKKIVGLPGDRLTHFRGRVFMNNNYEGSLVDNYQPTQPQVIPSQHYFVKGEHPDSLDSRYRLIGLVHQKDIHYKGYALDNLLSFVLGKGWVF